METPVITGKKRDRVGTRYSRRLRAAGQMPAVVYGHKEDPIAIAVDENEMLRYLHHGSRLFTVKIDGAEQTCLVKDLQFDHLGTDVIHVDLSRVDLTEEVEVTVSIHFTGEAVGLKAAGSIFRTVNDSISVRCLVSAIPSEIVVDVSGLDVGDFLAAGSVELPEGTQLATEPDLVLCRISTVAIEEEAPAEGEEGEVEDALAAGEEAATEESSAPPAGGEES